MAECVLSKEFMVASEIYKHNDKNEPIWFTRLVKSLSDYMTREEVAKALDMLSDWHIVEGHYGETEKGHAGWLYYIIENVKPTIEVLYETYWKDYKPSSEA